MQIIKERGILPKIKESLDSREILILIGARQVGKTSILKILETYLKDNLNHQTLYLNIEKEDVLLALSNYERFLDFLLRNKIDLNKKSFILLDEFQRLPSPTKLLKLLYDERPNIKIIATGSSSLDIHKKMREESLSGRKKIFNIYPLDFEEFLHFKYPEKEENLKTIFEKNLDLSLSFHEFDMALKEFIIWGGYPKQSLMQGKEEREESLGEIYDSYIQKDIAGLLKLEDSVTFTGLVKILSSQIGNLANINEMASTVNAQRSVIEKYLFILENTYIIKMLSPYHTNKRKEISKMPKIYFIDAGMRNFAQKNFMEIGYRNDNGPLAENFVFLELYKHLRVWHDLYFWRTPQGVEVDFVLVRDQEPFPIEVKYQTIKNPIVPSGIKAFVNHYSAKKAFVLTKDFYGKANYNGCEVTFYSLLMTAKIPDMC